MAKRCKNKKEEYEDQLLKAGLAGAQAETIQKYGSAVKEHVVAYAGKDNEIGQKLAKGLKDIAKSKLNPNDRERNIKQQAGFAAEVKTTARENAEKIIRGDRTSKVIRTDDMAKQPDGRGHVIGGKNEQLYDVAEVWTDGSYITETGRQLKYVGGDPESCYNKLIGKKFNKYRDADIQIEIPSDFYDDVQQKLKARKKDLEKQIDDARRKGDSLRIQNHQEQLERVEKTEKLLRKGKLTNAEAIEARVHPLGSTAKDIVNVSHRAGMESAKYGVFIGGSVSIVRNVVAVASGDKKFEDAVLDVAKDTATSGVISYGTSFVGATLKGTMKNAPSSTIQTLANTNLPSVVVTVAMSAATTLKRYYDGEIDGVQCFVALGEQGSGMISSAFFAAVGQVAIPIPVIGGMIGGMFGYAIASASYGTLLSALKEADLAAQKREYIEKVCEEQIQLIREYRCEVEELITKYLTTNMDIFYDAFSGIKSALEIGDVDGVITSSNQITEALGKKSLFNNMDELEFLMASNATIKI